MKTMEPTQLGKNGCVALAVFILGWFIIPVVGYMLMGGK